jgi:hypothetical protein
MHATIFLARLIGLVVVCVGASILFQRAVFVGVLNDLTKHRTSLFLVGIALLLAGLSIVLTHNVWNEGPLALVVTLIGWITVLRGLVSMFVPGQGIARMARWMKFEEFSWAYGILVVAIGAYLIWGGFTS